VTGACLDPDTAYDDSPHSATGECLSVSAISTGRPATQGQTPAQDNLEHRTVIAGRAPDGLEQAGVVSWSGT
jgi:hypothetical protein